MVVLKPLHHTLSDIIKHENEKDLDSLKDGVFFMEQLAVITPLAILHTLGNLFTNVSLGSNFGVQWLLMRQINLVMLFANDLAVTITCSHPRHPLRTQCSDAHSGGEKNALPSYDKFNELIDKINRILVALKVFQWLTIQINGWCVGSEMFMECGDLSTEQ
ncbi:hypothetical protein Cgig2_004491 [Carnegiea gigantea]|uniref:Uncharacterized protein n=1 Tax=Carnegiea gigantea TaxID=171969 RepID=A0A9Q1JRR8_9CARY|nr:hypothetical protein Cgig2_004491 [Carnegiea gigantea]